MANKKYVTLARLSNFLDNIKAKYSQIGHKHKVSDLTDYTVDSQLSPTSTNPVQNKVIDAEFDAIADAMGALELAVDGKANVSDLTDVVYTAEESVDTSVEVINADTLGGVLAQNYATKSFVSNEIAQAKLDGGDGSINLSGYATKDDLNAIDFPVDSVNGKIGSVKLTAADVGALPNTTVIPTVPTNVSAFTNDAGYLTTHQSLSGYATESYVNTQISAIPTPDVSGQISTHNASGTAHNDIRILINGLTTRLNTLADSNDADLDQMSEIVAYIKNNKSLIEQLASNKVNITDIINNLTTNATNKPLSAAQGMALKALIDAIKVPTKVSELNNDSKFITLSEAPVQSVNGKTGAVQLTADLVGALPNTTVIPSIDGLATEDYVNEQIAAMPIPDVSEQIGAHNTNENSHNDIRLLIEGLSNRLNTALDSDEVTLDQMSEIVAYIKNNKDLIDGITTSKVNVDDIINNLTTNVSNKPLSAAQGVALKALVDAIKVPTNISELTNDKGYLTSVPSEYITETELAAKKYLTSFTETDPTVPAWAKASTKPTYTKSEVGLSNVDNVKQYSANNPPPYPVTSVNNKIGAISLSASDVGAAPSNHNHNDLYEQAGSVNTALQSAKTYTDNAVTQKTQVQIITWGADD